MRTFQMVVNVLVTIGFLIVFWKEPTRIAKVIRGILYTFLVLDIMWFFAVYGR